MSAHKVGGEVDGYCTKCKMVLAHTILAMVGDKLARVRCNTCNGEHAYKARAPGEAAPKAAKAAKVAKPKKPGAKKRTVGSKAIVLTFEELIATKDAANAMKYAPTATFRMDSLVDHPSFGLGVVTGVKPDKVDVTFKGDIKTLVHNRPLTGRQVITSRQAAPPSAHAGGADAEEA
jgi:hypothetical protein